QVALAPPKLVDTRRRKFWRTRLKATVDLAAQVQGVVGGRHFLSVPDIPQEVCSSCMPRQCASRRRRRLAAAAAPPANVAHDNLQVAFRVNQPRNTRGAVHLRVSEKIKLESRHPWARPVRSGDHRDFCPKEKSRAPLGWDREQSRHPSPGPLI